MESGNLLGSARITLSSRVKVLAMAAVLPCCLLSFFSCSPAAKDFSAALAVIDRSLEDALPVSGREAAFKSAYGKASNSGEWLSILKRARVAGLSGDAGLMVSAAGRAIAAMPGSEPVLKAGAYLMIRGGAPEKALVLFERSLSPDSEGDLFSEAFLECLRSGKMPAGLDGPEAVDRLARVLEDPRFFIDAATRSFASGDGFAARARLGLAEARGADVPMDPLWDMGLVAVLAARPDSGAEAEELRILGDSAWLAGKRDLAVRRWGKAVEIDPRGSWKTWASLACAATRSGTSSGSSAFRYYEGLKSTFPANAAAAAVYAAALARDGRMDEAFEILAPNGQPPTDSRVVRIYLSCGALLWPEERLVAEALRLTAERPEDARLLSAVLRVLFERHRFQDILVLVDTAERRELSYPWNWFYSALALALRGEWEAAAGRLEKDGAAEPGPVAAQALGTIYVRTGPDAKATECYGTALSLARGPSERCRILKAIGKLHLRSGRADLARVSFLAASTADPEDAEAALFAREPERADR